MAESETVHRELIDTMMKDAIRGPVAEPGMERCFYTLWGRENNITWETVSKSDLVDSIVPGTGRQDWRLLRPFDLLEDIPAGSKGVARTALYEGDDVRISCAHIVGSEPHFERGADFDTILFQFAGYASVQTSFGVYALQPGESLLIPAMVSHRTTGTQNCRRMEYRIRELLEVQQTAETRRTITNFRVRPEGDLSDETPSPSPEVPLDGKIREHLQNWSARRGEDYWFIRQYAGMTGRADSGRGPAKLSIFDYFVTTLANGTIPPVRQALLWDGPSFRQRVYSNPGRQPAPHRGYDEDELWFQFTGPIHVETEHGQYAMEAGQTSMAEAGVSHTSVSSKGIYRLTTYTPTPMRLVADPTKQLRETRWVVEELSYEAVPKHSDSAGAASFTAK